MSNVNFSRFGIILNKQTIIKTGGGTITIRVIGLDVHSFSSRYFGTLFKSKPTTPLFFQERGGKIWSLENNSL